MRSFSQFGGCMFLHRILAQVGRKRILLTVFTIMVVSFVSACNQSSTSHQQNPTSSSSHHPSTLPVFSDWRAAYIDGNSSLHAITLDGKKDIVGPNLPNFTATNSGFSLSGIGPDGHTLAYAAPSFNVINLTNPVAARYYPHIVAIYNVIWSNYGDKIALTDNVGNYWIADSKTGAPLVIPGGPFTARTILDGWIDTTHIAVSGYGPQATSDADKPSIFYIDSLDIINGQLHPIVAVTNPALGIARAVLSSDGTTAIFANTQFRDDPFTPMVAEIDMGTGSITPLPQITQATGAGFTSLAWQAGSSKIAVSTGFAENSNLKTWIIDSQHDTATHIMDGQYVEQWSPDRSMLIVSTGLSTVIGRGPYTISAVTFSADGHPSLIQLTQKAMSAPFLGFIRTSQP